MGSILSESEIEKKFIEQLILGESQWTYREDLRDEESLWDNFKDILVKNNTAKLVDHPLTGLEFDQIKSQLNFSSFYNAAVWLRGENGVARVYVQREDASLGTESFEVFRREDIAGGTSVYEVINQYKVDRLDPLERDRRFDVTLLINGLPMIHVELKNRSQGYMAAFEQIKKYESEGKFRGIYSMLQMFVVSNGVDTKYIASADAQHLNKEFLTSWVDSKNNRVDDYIDFAQAVLSIPQAHKMVTEFSVLDSERKSIILLRPYQIHAIQAMERAVARQQSGYVWHTTGSGKGDVGHAKARKFNFTPTVRLLAVKSEHDVDFLESAINNQKTIVESTGVPQLTAPQLANYRIHFPKLEEEEQIGYFFKILSDTITLHQRKLDSLHKLKTAYLQQLFPQNGELVPRLRFAKYNENWEQRKLGETKTFYTDGNYGESYPTENDMSDSEKGVPFLRGSNLKNGKLDISSSNYITLEKHKELTTGHLIYDDVVIAVRGSLGALGYVDKVNVDWNINSQLAIIRTDKNELSGAFIIQFLSSNRGQKELLSRQTGTALKQLPIKQLKDISVPVPNIEEQNKISDFLKKFDDTITLHQNKLEQLRSIKNAFLQKIFL